MNSKYFIITFLTILTSGTVVADEISVAAQPDSSVIQYALTRLKLAVETGGDQLVQRPLDQAQSCKIVLCSGSKHARLADIQSSVTGPEGYHLFSISSTGSMIWAVAGSDDRGLLYGTLDLAEQIRLTGSLNEIEEKTVQAHFPFRAIKFNLPWMSYRRGKALQIHRETCRDLKYWESFLDMMAENRFNALTLWNLHPFTFMIRPRNFPQACPFDDKELADWQHFWKTLFKMARERGIETYIVNWNIFVSPEFAEAKNVAEYSKGWKFWGDGDRSKLVERYTRECVTQVIDEYSDLTGIGITLGERMGGMTAPQRRDWLDRTIIAGMRNAKRKAKLLHRAPLSPKKESGKSTEQLTREYLEKLTDVAEPIKISFKFNFSHGHSSPHLMQVHGKKSMNSYWNPKPKNYEVLWTVRNEDFFVLRWGQPDFIREFISLNSHDYVGGCIIGSQCYIPAKDYITKPGPHKTWDYAFQRQWLFYQMWGRLLYDPQTPDSLFTDHLALRFGKKNAPDLLTAWKLASLSANRFASFYRGTWDASIYTEGFTGWRNRKPAAFINVDALINRPVLDPQYVSIRSYVKAGGKIKEEKIAPLDLAEILESDCSKAMELIKSMKIKSSPSPPLKCEMADIESWCWHGLYFAQKLRGATYLAMYRATGTETQKEQAVSELEKAFGYWEKLTESITRYNHEIVPYIFDKEFSWKKYEDDVNMDIEIAKFAEPEKKDSP